MKPIPENVKKVVAAILGTAPEAIKPEERFGEDLGADSLDLIEIVMATEEEFKTEITDEQAEKFVTVGDIITLLEARFAE